MHLLLKILGFYKALCEIRWLLLGQRYMRLTTTLLVAYFEISLILLRMKPSKFYRKVVILFKAKEVPLTFPIVEGCPHHTFLK